MHQNPGHSMQYVGFQPPIHPEQQQFHQVPLVQPPVLAQPIYVNPQTSTHYQLPNQTVVSTGAREGDGFLKRQPTDSEKRFLEFENTDILHRFKEDRYEN